ncbi:ABC transporter permease subunit [Paenibacillus sp. 19GGS1-52]|uniref:ABC transporter permease n=1 Tax=Paenibacillus sp. 19GGS1-52 TaxID=2758563 RepID=UPI001EFB6980|nr:ABC transporter permease subunit [Paenibacillus sp. 19GGS1-52]ULO07322.1 ABC transporter permease subunit [Paenibacillus sp. 19GGS1-52]
MKLRKRGVILALLPFALMVLAFQLVPILSMLTGSFRNEDGTGFTLGNYLHALQSAYYMQAIKNSLLISISSSLLGIVIGLVCAYCITRFTPAVRDRLLMLSNMTSNFAGVPLAFAYIILLGNNGVFTLLFKQWGWSVFSDFNLYSWSGLILVYVYFQVPLALLLLYPSFYGIREQWREAASLLGAGPWQFWKTIGLPILSPAIFGTLGILFANAMGAYATAYALVGGNYNLLAVRIGSLVAGDVVTQPQMGSTLAVLLALTTLLAVYLNHRMLRRAQRFGSSGPLRKPQPKGNVAQRLRPAAREEM